MLKNPACKNKTDLFFPPLHDPQTLNGGGCVHCPESCGICQKRSGVPICDVCHNNEQVERAPELDSKTLCVTCPVIDACLDKSHESGQKIGQFNLGVVGGMNRWEHQWLDQASESDRNELARLHEQLGHQKSLDLRVWFEEAGPKQFSSTSPIKVAAEYGMPFSVAKRWLDKSGLGRIRTKDNRKNEQTQALLALLADYAWHSQSECVRIAAEAIPQERAEQKAAAIDCSVESARKVLARTAIRERIRYNQVSIRTIQGERHIRWRKSVRKTKAKKK